ncbi:MAG TPA: hypothetical protein VEX40_01110 [Mycobacterium sp.]|nr:hypothetical protein [Mycobacterium sp.]
MSDLGKRLGDAAARPGLAILASEDQGVGTDDQIEQLHQAVMRTSPNFSNSSKSIRMVPKLVIAQQKRIGDTRADFDPMLRRYVTPAGLIGTTRADFRAQSFDRNYFLRTEYVAEVDADAAENHARGGAVECLAEFVDDLLAGLGASDAPSRVITTESKELSRVGEQRVTGNRS